MQASYLVMKSSHSGTPIFSAIVPGDIAAIGLAAMAGGLVPAVELAFFSVLSLLHPTKTRAKRIHNIRESCLNIWSLLSVLTADCRTISRIEKRGNDTNSFAIRHLRVFIFHFVFLSCGSVDSIGS